MDHEMEVEVFRAGDYGPRGRYSEEDLEQIAADYAPSTHEAPVTVDHKQEGPALGWVRALRRIGSVLVARLGALDPDFVEKVREGAFKKRSIELYRCADWTNRPYLRSVSFLGACPPAVKGLADPVFSEEEDQTRIEFEESCETSCEDSPKATAPAEETPPAEPTDASMSEADLAPSSNPTEAVNSSACETDERATLFCERLREEGKLLPAWEERGIGRFLSSLDAAAPVPFSDKPDHAPATLRDWFERFLEALPSSVPMGEAAQSPQFTASPSAPQAFAFNERPGSRVDPESLSLHRRVERYRAMHPQVSYAEALHSIATLR